MPGPFDYITPNASVNPFATALQGLGAGQQIAQQQQTQQLQAQQIKAQLDQAAQYQKDVSAVLNNPNSGAKDFAGLQLKYPQIKDATKGAFDALSTEQQQNKIGTVSRIYSALNSGRQDLAIQLANDQLKALENTAGANPQEINALKGNIQLLQTLPIDQARNATAMVLANMADPKQFGSIVGQLGNEQRAQEQAPAVLANKQLEADKTRAEIDNTKSQIGERAARLGLDRDKFNLDFDKTLAELRDKQAVRPSAGMEKVQADSVASAGVADQASTNAAQLADQFAQAGAGYGVGATIAEKFASLTGRQDALTALRKQYVAIKNQAALANLPPGPASDKDIAVVQAAFLPETADSKQIADWLRSFSNVQRAVAQRENARADWISEYGSVGTSKKDGEVQGIQVPAGTSFNDFVKRGLKVGQPQVPAAQPASAQPRYMQPNLWSRPGPMAGSSQNMEQPPV